MTTPTSDDILSLWNEVMKNNRAGLDAMQYFARELLARYGAPVTAQAQPHIDDGDLDRVAHIIDRYDAAEIGLWGVVEEIMAAFGARFYPSTQDLSAGPNHDIVELAREGMEVHAGMPDSPEYRVCAELVRIADAVAAADAS